MVSDAATAKQPPHVATEPSGFNTDASYDATAPCLLCRL